jgi:cytochrome c biogenesis protein CcmG/thiol:disulfide interchange protein DsbE
MVLSRSDKFVLRAQFACAVLLMVLSGVATAQESKSLVGQRAPAFAIQDLHGAHVELEKDRGKVVLLNFWATWCGPCKVEMPRFMQWQKQYGPQGLQVIGVSIDDTAAPARAYVEKLHLNYPVVMGDAKLGARYGGVLGVPVTFLIDRAGVVRARFDGEEHLAAEERQVRALLGAGP